MKNNFCDFCSCNNCKYGYTGVDVRHAKTSTGHWICDVCYEYDVCTSGPDRNPDGPCEEEECVHRPTLVSGWVK